MANLSSNTNFSKRCGGFLAGGIATHLIKQILAGSSEAISIEGLAETFGESQESIRRALRDLQHLDIVRAPFGKCWADTSVFQVQGFRVLTIESEQPELEFNGQEIGDAGDGPVFRTREQRGWDERVFAAVTIRGTVERMFETDNPDGTLGYALRITKRDNGSPLDNEIVVFERLEFPNQAEAWKAFDDYSDAYEEDAPAPLERAQPIQWAEDMIRLGYVVREEGGGPYEFRLKESSVRALREAFQESEIVNAEDWKGFDVPGRDWSVFVSEDGLEIDGYEEASEAA